MKTCCKRFPVSLPGLLRGMPEAACVCQGGGGVFWIRLKWAFLRVICVF